VKKSHLLAILAAAVLLTSFVVRDASAQQPVRTAMRPATQAAPLIALLDVSYIFKNHSRFKAMMDDMKADVQRAETQVKAETEALQKLAERAKDYRKGTPDYKAIEEEVAKRRADITVRVQLQKREFIEQEAKIYHNIYQEISQEVDYYCKANRVAMVLRFNGDPVDAGQPENVLRNINKPVVWYSKERDITPIILDALNKRAFQGTHGAGTNSRPGVAPYQR